MKLGTKAAILFTPLVVLLCGISSGSMLYFHEAALRASVHAGIDGIARAHAHNISAFLHDSQQRAKLIAANLPVEALRAGSTAKVEAYLQKMGQLDRFANGVFILDGAGRFLADYPPHPELRGNSFAFREYFQRTISEQRGVVGQPYFSKRTGAPVLTFTAPVLNSRKSIVGVVACSVDLLAPQALGAVSAQRIGKTGYVYVYDKSRLMVLHPDRSRLLKRDIPEGANRLLDQAIKGFEGVGETTNSRGVDMLVGFRSIPDTNWIVGVQIPKDEVFASLYESRRLMVGTALLFTLLLLIIGTWAMQAITLPLHHLHSAATTIMDELGNPEPCKGSEVLGLLDNIRTRDEIGDLSCTLGELVKRQRQSVGMLRKVASEWELTFNSVHESVLCLDCDGTILRINRTAGEWLRVHPAAAVGKPAQLFIPWDSTETPAWLAPDLLDTEHQRTWAGFLNTREGNYLFSVSPIRDCDTVSGILMLVRDVTEQTRMDNAIRQIAFNDALTGLPNRLLLMDRLEQSIISCQRKNCRCAILFLDLDRFKPVNDSYGHDAGDELLRQVAGRLQAGLRRNDTVARFGGDEFVILLPELPDKEVVALVAEKIIKSLGEPFEIGGHLIQTGSSIGIAVCPDHGSNAADLIARADAAMYAVKREGRGNYRMYSPEGQGTIGELTGGESLPAAT